MDADDKRGNGKRRRPGAIRASDLEPYTALRWVGTLFKAAAIFLAVAMLAEFIAGLRFEGTDALPVLLGEAARLAVIAVVLWGAGDLVRLLIDVGHDLRAQRVLLGRIGMRIPSPSVRAEEEAVAERDGRRAERLEVRPKRAEAGAERAEARPERPGPRAERPQARAEGAEAHPERQGGREAA